MTLVTVGCAADDGLDPAPLATTSVDCDVLVVGDSTGAFAAAFESAMSLPRTLGGRATKTCLVGSLPAQSPYPTIAGARPWIGGQLTSQGMPALDEFVPSASVWTGSYKEMRERVKSWYVARYGLPFRPDDPGVSRRNMSFEPPVAVIALNDMVAEANAHSALEVRMEATPTAVVRAGAAVTGVTFQTPGGALTLSATVTIDATDLGDLLPLAGTGYRLGLERYDTYAASPGGREPLAANVTADDPTCIQPFTYPFAMQYLGPGRVGQAIAMPSGYTDAFWSGVNGLYNDDATYTSIPPQACNANWLADGSCPTGATCCAGGAAGPYICHLKSQIASRHYCVRKQWHAAWLYRRELGGADLAASAADISMQNTPEQDFNRACYGGIAQGCNPIVNARPDLVYQAGRNFSLGLAYWLRHRVPNDGFPGYDFLELRREEMGTYEGTALRPYYREGRRLRSLLTMTEPLYTAAAQYSDSLGISYYQVDLHPCAAANGNPGPTGIVAPARKVDIALGMLVPEANVDGFLAGSKDAGTSHIINGAYRVHPNEWAIGQAAGAVAAQAVIYGVAPRRMTNTADAAGQRALRAAQQQLVYHDASIAWTDDIAALGRGDATWRPIWHAMQMVDVMGIMSGYADATMRPTASLTRAQGAKVIDVANHIATASPPVPPAPCDSLFEDIPCYNVDGTVNWQYTVVMPLARAGYVSGYACGGVGEPCDPAQRPYFRPNAPMLRRQFAKVICNVQPQRCDYAQPPPPQPTYCDVPGTDPFAAFVEAGERLGLFAHDLPQSCACTGRCFGAAAEISRGSAARWLWNDQRGRLALPVLPE